MSAVKTATENGAAEPELGDAAQTSQGTSQGSSQATRSGLRAVGGALVRLGGRIAYWTPVFAALGLFAQVSFLGLRPALSEGRRLADASDVLQARWETDLGLYDAYELQVRVRQDPVFRERQRRMACAIYATPQAIVGAGLDAGADAGPGASSDASIDTGLENGVEFRASTERDASGT